jgi:hypothetical protein
MKKILPVLILFIFALHLKAQNSIPLYISLSGGVSLPLIESDFSDGYNIAPTVSVGLEIKLNNYLIAKANYGYNYFSAKGTQSSQGLSIFSYELCMNIGNFNSKNITPYGILGIGGYTLSIRSISNTNLGFNLGCGLAGSFQNKINPYGEILLNYNFNSGTAKGFLPVRFGVILKL